MRATYQARWAVCEGCDTRVPATWIEPSERDDVPLCEACRAKEHAEDERDREAASGPIAINEQEGWR